jgi:hypothetical protein
VPGQSTKPTLPPPPTEVRRTASGALSRSLERDAFGREIAPPETASEPAPQDEGEKPKREAATESIGRRAGALSDELDFPEFVASLVHGTFDAIVDSSIRQMESFADLVAAVAKPVEQFTQENVSLNQARDWLVEQYPKDLTLERSEDGPRVVPRARPGDEGEQEAPSPNWLTDFGLDGQELTPDFIEENLVPKARERVARQRLQTLATMVLLGMNRVVVRDGTIGARLRFRAAAADHTKLDYAVSDDQGQESPASEWGSRGSRSYAAPRTRVSTVGVNVQSDSELKAELFGEIKINFASETVPLERFVDDAKRTALERHARPARVAEGVKPVAAAPPATTPAAAAPVSNPAPVTGGGAPAAAPGAVR